MTELRRLLDEPDADALARDLLRSAGEDRPKSGAILGAAAAIGVAAAFSKSAAASSAGIVGSTLAATELASGAATGLQVAGLSSVSTSLPLFGLIAKHVGLGIVAGAAVMGGVTYAVDQNEPVAERQTVAAAVTHTASVPPLQAARFPSSSSQETSEGALPEEPASPENPVAPGAGRETPLAKPVALHLVDAKLEPAIDSPKSNAEVPVAEFAIEAPAPSVDTAAPSQAEARATELSRQLAEEVALLDRARAALLRKDARDALRVLDEYGTQRRSGTLEPETLVLRIQALREVGDRPGAAQLARRFIQRYPESRHVAALRKLAFERP